MIEILDFLVACNCDVVIYHKWQAVILMSSKFHCLLYYINALFCGIILHTFHFHNSFQLAVEMFDYLDDILTLQATSKYTSRI